MKLNKEQLAKVKSIKKKMAILNKKLDSLEKECYVVLNIDADSPVYNHGRDWIFDYLYNDGDFVRCLENAGFEI
jgi:hypothetical protein